MGTNASGCWVWAFLKTEKDTKRVEPVGLGVGLFTGLLRAFSFALWRWEAEELKYCSRETGKSCGEEMDLQPDELTGLAAGSESCRSHGGSAPGSTLMCAPLQTCSSADKLMEHSGVLSQRAGGEDDLRKSPLAAVVHLDVFPMAGQAGSRSVPQMPRCSAVTFPSSTAAAPLTLPYPPPQVPHVLPLSCGHPPPPA